MMCKHAIFLMSFALMLSLIGNASADPSLVGWWKLDDGQGSTAFDWSDYGYHGTLMGDPQWVTGYNGGALELDGAGDYIEIPSLGINSNTVTMTAWIRRNGNQNGWSGIIFHRTAGRPCGMGFSGQTGMINHLQYHWNDDSYLTWNFASGLLVPDNEWAFVALVVQPSQATLYLNGTTDFAVNEIHHIEQAFTGPLLLGLDSFSTSRIIRGAIDDARVYTRALTPKELEYVMTGNPFIARDPHPADGSIMDIIDALPLTWSPGDHAIEHDVYFGIDEGDVNDADTTDTTGIYRGRQTATSYTPHEGVEWGGGPYYWRIDEHNSDETIEKGNVWCFAIADYFIVDDFEDYNADRPIWQTWLDGLGFGASGTPDFFAGNGSGSMIGNATMASLTEETIVHEGKQSMLFQYDNNKEGFSKYSQTERMSSVRRDWTEKGITELSLWFRGYPLFVGGFTEDPAGTYTMTASGDGIWNTADQFHYAYKTLIGAGSILARVESIENTDPRAKAGVMIRETLDAGSKHAFAAITPGNGVVFQRRVETDDDSDSVSQSGITAPHWVKLERTLAGQFIASYSADGTTWEPVKDAVPQNISMGASVYIGLALTSHDSTQTCEAVFSDVTMTGLVGELWAHEDIGITRNAAEPMYVALSNATGPSAVVVHEDPGAATIDTWTEWVIPLQAFAEKGVNLTDVDSMAMGFGIRGNMTNPGGSGTVYFDDIRLY